ncbi:MAG: DUF4846 domain-containing protein [Flavobacteriales bacterium]|nr:DUF4846 domain-containing protein [Flavobacteriales bacterium]
MKNLFLLFFIPVVSACDAQSSHRYISETGNTVNTRFTLPEGFKRTSENSGSFAYYLRHFPLKPHGAEVYYFDGRKKANRVHEAVLDIDVGTKDLQQCADAVMRLRGEYLFKTGQKNRIAFHFTNGFRAAYAEWSKGKRMKVEGNKTYWVKSASPDTGYASFRKYMDLIFMYAGTRSLEKEMKPVLKPSEIQIGDVFIQGGSPGHAVIVMDKAVHGQTGEILFLLAQSYMPAQSIHILKNPVDSNRSPWYALPSDVKLITPEWTFLVTDLKRFE